MLSFLQQLKSVSIDTTAR